MGFLKWLRLTYYKIIHQKYLLVIKFQGAVKYWKDFIRYFYFSKHNPNFLLEIHALKSCYQDATINTAIDATCFYQNAWCARKVFADKPKLHYDIGSEAGLMGIISQFVPVTMIDIRPIDLLISGLNFKKGDITNLPFKDNSISSLSCICVIEHIGLGRYGDPLDPYGSEKAIKELIRVLSLGGSLYFSVPVDRTNRIYFNAHRAFTREYLLEMFSPLKMKDEAYLYKRKIYKSYDSSKGFGTGLFHLVK